MTNYVIHKEMWSRVKPWMRIGFFGLLMSLALLPCFSMQAIYYQDKVIVLMYHHIDEGENDATISPARFVSHLDKLIEKGYHIISMDEYLDFVFNGNSLPPNAVVLTFDDGYESFYTHAYPELKKRGLSATNFLIVKATDLYDPQALPHLDWDQIREMKANGMSFYSHTYDQHRKANTTATGSSKPMLAHHLYLESENRIETEAEYVSRIKEDLVLAEQRLAEELGVQPHLLAYPFGSYNDTVIEVAQEIGYEMFFTITEGINDKHQRQIYRINATGKSATDLIKIIGKYAAFSF